MLKNSKTTITCSTLENEEDLKNAINDIPEGKGIDFTFKLFGRKFRFFAKRGITKNDNNIKPEDLTEEETKDSNDSKDDMATKILLNSEQKTYLCKKVEKYEQMQNLARKNLIWSVITVMSSIIAAAITANNIQELKHLTRYLLVYGITFLISLLGTAKFWSDHTELGEKKEWLKDLIDELSNSQEINNELNVEPETGGPKQ